jgi:hypothetical protein
MLQVRYRFVNGLRHPGVRLDHGHSAQPEFTSPLIRARRVEPESKKTIADTTVQENRDRAHAVYERQKRSFCMFIMRPRP